MTIDFEGHRIIFEDKVIYLTKTENSILETICNNKQRVTTYQDVADKIYQINCDNELKALIRRHITLLRKKIGQYIKIKTVREVGYIIEEDLK